MKSVIDRWYGTLRKEGMPDEWEAKQLLAQIDVPVPRGMRLLPEEATIPGALDFPVVLKVCDPEILHKTERGGVLLNVSREEFDTRRRELAEKFPGSPLMAEEMCRFSQPEFIVGGLMDSVLGPAIMAGAGGILTEIYKDVAFRLCPLPEDEAERMLEELNIRPVFHGFRGSTLERRSLARIISRMGELFAAFDGRLEQFDLNPVVHTATGWKALDCVLVLNKPTTKQGKGGK